MPRTYPIGDFKAGITRLRTKGGANKESLYDLVNAHLTAANSVEPRQGTVWDLLLPAGTKGLTSFEGKLHTFASSVIASTSPLVVINTLRHPTNSALTLKAIHFAEPIMRGLYVAAEFSNDETLHYWLQRPDPWAADTAYQPGSIVAPNVANGFIYRASRLNAPNLLWQADIARAIGDTIEPTTPNGFYYTVIVVDGATPKSGATEPTWPAEEGATVRESPDIEPASAPVTAPPTTTGPGDGGGAVDYCLAVDQWLAPGIQVADVEIGSVADGWCPSRGRFAAKCVGVGGARLEPCVRLVMASGATVVCSRTTPVNFTTATQDMEDGHWGYAPHILGAPVLDDFGGSLVVAVEDVGERWVRPLSFGGVSFAGGERPDARVFTHNMAKPDPEDTP